MNGRNFIVQVLHFPWKLSVVVAKIIYFIEKMLPPALSSRFSLGNYLYLKLFRVDFGSSLYFHDLPYIFCRNGKIVIGDRCGFGEFTKLFNFGEIEIGSDFMAAAGLQILTGGHDPDTWESIIKKVRIGNRVWCGANVTIMPGVCIGDDCVVGAGSLVTKDVPSGTIVAGVPAKKLNSVDMEKRKLLWKQARH